MTQTILTFGDSNSYGTPPMGNREFHARMDTRWPTAMQSQLGCTLIEDGLPGRTACALPANVADTHLDGQLGLRIALTAQGPIDHLMIMLGTNDTKTSLGLTPPMILAGIAGLLAFARSEDIQHRHGGFGITLICPPPVAETGTFVPEFLGAAAKSAALAAEYAALAEAWQIGFVNAGDHIAVDPLDGVHFDAAAHQTLGTAIARYHQSQLA